MELTYREWGRYVAHRTHKINTDELRKYLEENFINSGVPDLSDDIIEEILYGSSDYEDSMIYDKETNEAHYLTDIVVDWVQGNLYEDDYEWEIYETDMNDDELVHIDY